MSRRLYAARIDGPCDEHLSLHSTFEGAVAALLQTARGLHLDRFGYVPSGLPALSAYALRGLPRGQAQQQLRHAEDIMTGSGWRARVVELVVDELPVAATVGRG